MMNSAEDGATWRVRRKRLQQRRQPSSTSGPTIPSRLSLQRSWQLIQVLLYLVRGCDRRDFDPATRKPEYSCGQGDHRRCPLGRRAYIATDHGRVFPGAPIRRKPALPPPRGLSTTS